MNDIDAHKKIVAAINATWPGKQWALSGDDLTGFKWLDSAPAPTLQQLTDAVNAMPRSVP